MHRARARHRCFTAVVVITILLSLTCADFGAVIYVSVDGNNTVAKIPSSGTSSTFASGLNFPSGLAFNSVGGLLYVADYSGSKIRRYAPNGTFSTLSNLSIPYGLALDAVGNVYASHLGTNANANVNTISKITPTGVVTTFAVGLDAPSGLAFDLTGNLYVANRNANNISKITPAGAVSTFAVGFNTPNGLAFGSTGDLYVADWGTNSIKKISPGGVVSTFISTGLNHPLGLAMDGADNLFVSNFDGDQINKIDAAGNLSVYLSGIVSPSFIAVPEPSALVSLVGVLLLRRPRRSRDDLIAIRRS